MKISLKQIETFVCVADLESFRRAAARLNTTQPNISSRIASLENILGTSLMDRDAGSVRLTARGKELLVHARRVLRSMEEFVEAVDDSALFDEVLRLGVTELVVHTWLREFLQEFKERYPNTSVELNVDLSANLEKELEDQTIDLAFQSGPFRRRMTGNLSLGGFPMVWVSSADSNLHALDEVSFDDLAKFPIITHARNTRLYEEVIEHVALRPDQKVRIVPCSNLQACVQMTIDGFGVSALLKPLVEKDIAAGNLHPINYHWVPDDLEFYARYDDAKASNVIKRAAELARTISNKWADRY